MVFQIFTTMLNTDADAHSNGPVTVVSILITQPCSYRSIIQACTVYTKLIFKFLKLHTLRIYDKMRNIHNAMYIIKALNILDYEFTIHIIS